VAASPAGGTTTRGSATPTAAVAGATTSVGRGSRTRGRRDSGWRAGVSPGRRRTGGLAPRRRLTAGRSAVESRGRSGRLIRHGELLEEKLIPHGVEGGEGHAPLDESLQVAVAGAEATQEVQHQGTIDNWLAEIAESQPGPSSGGSILPRRGPPERTGGAGRQGGVPVHPDSRGTGPRERATPGAQCPPGRG
jgi:hypothetical protein